MTQTKETPYAKHVLLVRPSDLRTIVGPSYEEFLQESEKAYALYDTPEKRAILNAPLEKAQGSQVRAALLAAGYKVPTEAVPFINALYRVRWLFKLQTTFSLIWDYYKPDDALIPFDDIITGGYFRVKETDAFYPFVGYERAIASGLQVAHAAYVGVYECPGKLKETILSAHERDKVQWDSLRAMFPEECMAFEKIGGLAGLPAPSWPTPDEETEEDYDAFGNYIGSHNGNDVMDLLNLFCSHAHGTTASFDDLLEEVKSVFGTKSPPFSFPQIRAIWDIQTALYSLYSFYIDLEYVLQPPLHADATLAGYYFNVSFDEKQTPSDDLLAAMRDTGLRLRRTEYVVK